MGWNTVVYLLRMDEALGLTPSTAINGLTHESIQQKGKRKKN